MERHMSSTLYRAAKEGDFHYLTSDALWKEIKVSSDTPSEERDERRRYHVLSLTQEGNNCLHIAARFGQITFVWVALLDFPSLLYQKNKKGDNPLHVAARAGHLKVVKLLTGSFQPSPQSNTGRMTANSATAGEADGEGNIETIQQQTENGAALTDSVQPPTCQSQSTGNSAAAGGDIILEMTTLGLGEAGEEENRGTLLTDFNQQSPSSQSESTSGTATGISSEWPSLPVWRTQNNDGSTALHEALRSKHWRVAWHLLDLEIPDCEPVVLVINAKDESPLYLAAEAGFHRILIKILEILKEGGHLSNTHVNGVLDERHIVAVGPKGQSPLHAAVLAQSPGCIKLLHNWIPGLIRKPDSYGKTALYYTAQENALKILRLLLELDASSAYICDNQGLSPLLVAASIGNPPSIRVILKACPASIESTDNNGCNALHLALKHNTFQVFKRLLKMPEMMTLINQPDQEGNTALHLATKCHKYWHLNALLSTKDVDLTAKNNLGQTALDLCALDWELTARQTEIWRKLRGRKASWGRVRPLMRFAKPPSIFAAMPRADATDLKQVANTQAVVAALLATVTFAAVLQIPGGYESSGPNLGSPALIDNPALIVFLLSDTISLCCSIMALYLLLNATRIDTAFLRGTVAWSHNLLNRSLMTAIIAFISGIYAVISVKSKWLAILVCIFGSSVPFLRGWIESAAKRFTPFVPGLLRKQITRPIIREEVPGE